MKSSGRSIHTTFHEGVGLVGVTLTDVPGHQAKYASAVCNTLHKGNLNHSVAGSGRTFVRLQLSTMLSYSPEQICSQSWTAFSRTAEATLPGRLATPSLPTRYCQVWVA